MSNGAYMEMNKSALSVVCDAGPLIHLDELDSLPLLSDFDKVLVPEQVWQEIEKHRPNDLADFDLLLQKVSVVISSQAAFQTLGQALSLGLG